VESQQAGSAATGGHQYHISERSARTESQRAGARLGPSREKESHVTAHRVLQTLEHGDLEGDGMGARVGQLHQLVRHAAGLARPLPPTSRCGVLLLSSGADDTGPAERLHHAWNSRSASRIRHAPSPGSGQRVQVNSICVWSDGAHEPSKVFVHGIVPTQYMLTDACPLLALLPQPGFLLPVHVPAVQPLATHTAVAQASAWF
jgi:hypothetical protein